MSPCIRLARLLRVTALLAALAAATPQAAGAKARASGVPISVMASSELASALLRIDSAPEYSFADSDLLANSLRLGARADVLAAADTQDVQALARAGKIDRPLPFASTHLVLIVPRSNPGRVRSVSSLARTGVSVLLGDPGVSFGSQARAVLARLDLGAVVLRARGREKNPRTLVDAVAAGHADAGIVYATDAAVDKGRLRVISIPAKGAPTVTLEIAVVKGSANRAAAAAFIREVRSRTGQRALHAAGFGKA